MISQLTLQVNTAGIGNAQGQINSLAQAVGQLQGASTVNLGSSFQAMAGGMGAAASAGSGLMSTLSGIGGTVQAGIGAFQQLKAAVDSATSAMLAMGQEGAKISQLGLAFNEIGGSAKKMEELRGMTGGIVDDVALQKAFNMATLFDIPREKIPAMLKAAQGASIAMGISAEKAVNDVMVAIARRSKPISDNIGVQMGNLGTLYEKFAADAGKSVKDLTEEEKSLAFTNEFLAKSTRQMSLAGAAQANVFAQLTAKATNAENEFKVFISGMLANSGALDFVTSSIHTMKQAFETAPKGVLMGAMKTLFVTGMELGKMLVPVFSAAVPVLVTALDLFNIFAPVITGTLQVVGKLTQGLILAVRVALIPFVKALDLVVWTIQELADTVGITTPSLDGMREGIDQFMSNTGEMLSAAVSPELTIEPVPVIPKTAAEEFVATASEKMQEELKKLDREAFVTLKFTTGQQVEEDTTGLANALIVPPEQIAYMRKWATETIRAQMGGGISDGLALAAGDSAAGAAEIFGALGADISGASEASLLAAGQALVATAQSGKAKAAMVEAVKAYGAGLRDVLNGGGVSQLSGMLMADSRKMLNDAMQGSLSGSDLIEFADVAKVEAAGGIKLFTKELGGVAITGAKFSSAVSEMNKSLQAAFGEDQEKKREAFFKGMYDSVNKFGLIKTDSPVQQMTANDINALLDYQDTVTALSDSGEVLTGSQALLTNAIRANGNTASGAVDALKDYERTLIQTGDALVWMRQQAAEAGKDTSGFTALLERQAAQLLNATKARTEAEKKAKDEKKGGGKKNDGKQALRERAEMVGLEDFEKARLQAERTLAKDMKTAGADASLKEAARTIYADAVGRPALDELARIGNALGGATTRIGGMLASSAKALFDNPEVAEMVKSAKTNLARAGLEMQTVDLGNGQSRRLTEREVSVNMELIALEKEWQAKRAILQEGSNAYLLVQSDYLLKKKALEDELKTQQEESAFAMLAGFEGVFSRVQGTFESLRDQGTVGEQAVAMLSGTVLSLGQEMAGMADKFTGIDKKVKEGSLTSGQAEGQKANAIVGAYGRATAGIIKNERARAVVQGAVELALAAASFALPGGVGIAEGIAHTAAAGLFFAAAGRGSGGTAAARNITPRRSAAGSDRNSTAGDRRQAQTQVNIFIDPLSGRGIVDTVNRDAGRQAGLAFNSRVMQGAARRTDL